MKKIKSTSILFTLFLTFFFQFSLLNAQESRQHPLEDAIIFTQTDNAKTKADILKKYCNDCSSFDILKTNNSFLRNFVDQAKDTAGIIATKLNVDGVSNNKSSSGLPDAATVGDAIGTFIAKRFREELTISFLNNFREKLEKEPYLGTIFPNAKRLMLLGDPFNYKVFLTSLRGALDKDIKALDENFPALLDTIASEANLDQNDKNKLKLFTTAYRSILTLSKNPSKSYQTITQTLHQFSKLDSVIVKNNSNLPVKVQGLEPSIKGGISFLYILTKEFGNSDYSDWVNKETLKYLIEPDTFNLFLGFVFEKNKELLSAIKIPKKNNISLYEFIKDNKNIPHIQQYAQGVYEKTNAIIEQISILRGVTIGRNARVLTFGDYQGLFNSSIALVNTLANDNFFKEVFNFTINDDNLKKFLKNVKHAGNYVFELQRNINDKNYGAIIVNTLETAGSIISDSTLKESKTVKEFIKYGNFAISIIGAESAEEMVTALENAALPAQSYRLKRNSHFSVTINSYAGIFGGVEFLTNDAVSDENSGLFAFAAPVGVAFNLGFTSKKPTKFSKYPTEIIKDSSGTEILSKEGYFKGSSLSFFLSVIDVGAIVSFRLQNDEAAIGDIQFNNLFAPGFHIIYGIRNSPISIGASVQYGPQLRRIEVNEGTTQNTIESRAFRAGVSLLVDIPIFSISAKTEKIRKKRKK